MQSLKEIVGLPVLMNGDCIGSALGAETDLRLQRIPAIRVSRGRFGERRIDSRAILQIGERSISVTNGGSRPKASWETLFRRAVATDGMRLGAIVDADFDEFLRITALWLCCSYPDDLLSGRKRIERYTVRDSDGTVLIPSGEEEEE